MLEGDENHPSRFRSDAPTAEGKTMEDPISKSTGPKIIDGFVIDLKATNLAKFASSSVPKHKLALTEKVKPLYNQLYKYNLGSMDR